MSPITVSSAVIVAVTQGLALLHLQALVAAFFSSSLELAPHHAEPGHGRYEARQRVKRA